MQHIPSLSRYRFKHGTHDLNRSCDYSYQCCVSITCTCIVICSEFFVRMQFRRIIRLKSPKFVKMDSDSNNVVQYIVNNIVGNYSNISTHNV